MTENGSLQEPAGDGLAASNGSPQPPVIEGPGRYVVYAAPDGGWKIARAGDLCERCLECGCGEQADLIEVPGWVIALASQTPKQRLLSMLGKAAGR